MKSFEEYFNEDAHGHVNFDAQNACFAAYIGRLRRLGNATAKRYVLNQADIKSQYDGLLLRQTSGLACSSASSIVNNAIGVYTYDANQVISLSSVHRDHSEQKTTMHSDDTASTLLSPSLDQHHNDSNKATSPLKKIDMSLSVSSSFDDINLSSEKHPRSPSGELDEELPTSRNKCESV
ncbi:hypothetical protein FBU30_001208 [Linnemannia zychae]|nr:hypothetical protein FBU30_001208 [Linnemannia zychae]